MIFGKDKPQLQSSRAGHHATNSPPKIHAVTQENVSFGFFSIVSPGAAFEKITGDPVEPLAIGLLSASA
jgi:hypothetical protein